MTNAGPVVPKSVTTEGWLGTVGGALAVLLPIIGWASILAGVGIGSTTTPGPSGAAEGLGIGVMVSLVLGGVGLIAWLGGVIATIVGLARGAAGSRGRGLVFTALALAILAVVSWIVEWVVLFSMIDTHNGAFRM